MITIYFEGHALTSDNEANLASGHNDVDLSDGGRSQAAGEKRQRYEDLGIDTIFTSDLRRAYDTAKLMFEGRNIPIFQDARLRECDYGDLTQRPRTEMKAVRAESISNPFPTGESLQQVMDRMKNFIDDLSPNYHDQSIFILGHAGTLWGLAHHVNGIPLTKLISGEFVDTGTFTI